MAGAILLALALPPLLAEPGAHAGHSSRDRQTPVFSAASHGAEASHWEAADRGHGQRCPACLAPSKTQGPAPAAAADQIVTMTGSAAKRQDREPAGPDAARLRRPRAPPAS